MLNTAPRFAEPDDFEPDFTGFMGEFIAEDITVEVFGLQVPIREIRIEFTGDEFGLDWDEARLTDARGLIVWVKDVRTNVEMDPDFQLIRAVRRFVKDREREIYGWAREQVEG